LAGSVHFSYSDDGDDGYGKEISEESQDKGGTEPDPEKMHIFGLVHFYPPAILEFLPGSN
jgi:hypothetical protein